MTRAAKSFLSVVVIAYNMEREIERTLRSLSPAMQRNIGGEEYEIILLDNGSNRALEPGELGDMGVPLRFRRIEDAQPSPVLAVNRGLEMARGNLVGVLIDGARLASPGLLHHARLAARLHHRPVISTLGFHLGPDVQARSTQMGYDQSKEDRLLASVDWVADAYRLFDISVFAESSRNGWFGLMAESNALFLPRKLWHEIGGYDEGFTTPGGGLVNLDTYARACALPDSQVIVLLGEGTFHQVHGGIASNAAKPRWAEFHAEYKRLRGHDFVSPRVEPLYMGSVPVQALPSIEASARQASQHTVSSVAGPWGERET